MPDFLILFIIVSAIIHQIGANFHISYVKISDCASDNFVECPSNYLKCNCWINGDRARVVSDNLGSIQDFFHLEAGLCGMGVSDSKKGDGAHFDFYVDRDDGTLQDQCFFNSFNSACAFPEMSALDLVRMHPSALTFEMGNVSIMSQ